MDLSNKPTSFDKFRWNRSSLNIPEDQDEFWDQIDAEADLTPGEFYISLQKAKLSKDTCNPVYRLRMTNKNFIVIY